MIRSVTKLQRGPCLKLIFLLRQSCYDYDAVIDELSEQFNINDLAEVRFKFANQPCKTNGFNTSISWKKHESAFDYTIKMSVTCEQLQYSKQCICTENFTDWIQIMDNRSPTSPCYGPCSTTSKYTDFNCFEVNLSVSKLEKITFAKLYEDDEFCNFNLTTLDDNVSVPVHKVCLIVHSDMFKRMLSSEWKETINGCIKIKGVTLKTLRQLKEYIYLGNLPDDNLDLQPLLLLAKCYMIENLKTECITKLAQTVKPEDLYLLQEFAVDNKLPELVRAMMQFTPDRTVQSAHQVENPSDSKEAGPPPAKKNKSNL